MFYDGEFVERAQHVFSGVKRIQYHIKTVHASL